MCEVLFVDATLGDGDVRGEEGRGRAVRRPVRVAHENLLLVGQVSIDPDVEIVDVEIRQPRLEVVLRARHRIARLIGQRKVLKHLECDRIHPARGNDVASERVADEARPSRIRSCGERVEDANQLAVLREGLRKISLTLRERRDRRGHVRLAPLAQPFEGAHEKHAAASNRSAGDAAELAAFEIAERLAGALREEVVGIQRRVPEELVRASMKVVRARFVDDVQDAAEAAAVLGRIIRAEHLELLDGIHGGKHGNAGEPVDGRERRRDAVDHRVHHRRSRAVHGVTQRVVVVADRSGHPRRQEDQ